MDPCVQAEDEPVSDAYARLSPDGAAHWSTFFERLPPMWAAEPDFTRAQVEGIRAPTLIIVGDRDIVRPEHAVEMFQTIPGSKLCIVPHAEHGDAEGDDPRVPP